MERQDNGGLLRMGVGPYTNEAATERSSLDEVAKGLASGTMSRSKALKVVGAAFLGAVSVGLFPVVAEAKGGHHHHHRRRRRKPPNPSTCTNGGCFQCGKPTKPGEACVCLTTTEG